MLGFPELAIRALDALTLGQLLSSVADAARALGKDPRGIIPRPPSTAKSSCKYPSFFSLLFTFPFFYISFVALFLIIH